MNALVIQNIISQIIRPLEKLVYILLYLVRVPTDLCKTTISLPNKSSTENAKKEETYLYDSKSAFKIQFW